MSKAKLTIQHEATRGKERFRLADFKRVVSMTWRYKRVLLAGVAFTVAYALLHTMGIGTAFPLFKVMLEEEGLLGWIDRSVAGARVGAEFAPAGDGTRLLLLDVDADSALFESGLRGGSTIEARPPEPARELLTAIAEADAEATLALTGRIAPTDTGAPAVTLSIPVGALDTEASLMSWVRRALPSDIDENKLRSLRLILGVLVVVIVLANVCRYVGEISAMKGVLLAMMDLRGKLYERTLLLPLSFYAGQPTADIVGRFVQDIQEVQRGMLALFARFIREPLRAVFILALALTLDWRLTLTIIVVAPVVIAIFWRVGRRVKRANTRLLTAYGTLIDAVTSTLHSLRVVKAYTAERQERSRLKQVDFRIYRQQLKLARLQALVSPLMETLAAVAASLVIVWLAGQVLGHQLSTSKFAALGVALSFLFDPLRKLTDVYVQLIRASAGAERVFQVIDEPIETSTGKRTLENIHGEISFAGVSFTYPQAETPALMGIDLTIAPGETVALVGANGSGKTTLASLIPRLYDPSGGRIAIDGFDIREFDLGALRRAIGLVSQDAVVFAGTPLENIAYGADELDPSRAEDAARRAHADSFINLLRGGYEAALGERGTTLSGGQRQRIAIARAIYRDAPILIFDEATSQIDSESERNIQQALGDFAEGRTTVIIAHRLSTIQFADRIVVLDAGKIVDSGAHTQLYERCTIYRALCDTQLASDTATSNATRP